MRRLGALLLKKKLDGSSKGSRAWWSAAAPDASSFAEVRDPVIESLPAADREVLAAIWQKRGGLELLVASGFSSLLVELFEHGSIQPVYEWLSQAVRDEVHHAQISVEMAAKYRGGEPIWPTAEKNLVPPFAPATGAMHATLYVIAMCCINETVACGVLQASMAGAESPLAKAALQTILTDEIDHARAGWAHLASPFVTPRMKEVLPQWLERLHEAKLRELYEDDEPLPGEAYPKHGMLSRERSRAVVRETLFEVMFPGFAAVGIDPSLAREWAEDATARAKGRIRNGEQGSENGERGEARP